MALLAATSLLTICLPVKHAIRDRAHGEMDDPPTPHDMNGPPALAVTRISALVRSMRLEPETQRGLACRVQYRPCCLTM